MKVPSREAFARPTLRVRTLFFNFNCAILSSALEFVNSICGHMKAAQRGPSSVTQATLNNEKRATFSTDRNASRWHTNPYATAALLSTTCLGRQEKVLVSQDYEHSISGKTMINAKKQK